MEPFERGIPELAKIADYNGSASAAEAIMTTDTIPKEVAVEVSIGGKTCRIRRHRKGQRHDKP